MAKLHAMTSMEYDDDEKLDTVLPMPMPNKPEFPYGLRICLTDKEFAKLDLDPRDAVVGGVVHGHFLARVTNVSMDESDNGNHCRVEMQIEDLAIESEDEENETDGD